MLIKTPCSRRLENVYPLNGGFELGPDTEKFSVACWSGGPDYGKESPSQIVSTADDRKRS